MSKRRRTQRQSALQETTRKPRPRPSAVASRRRLPSGRVMLIGVGVIAAVLFVGGVFVTSISATSYTCGEVSAAGGASAPEVQPMPNQESRHVAPGSKIRYTACPPTSGSHYAAAGAGPLRPGFYGPQAPAEPGGWVHNLEHGFAVVLYRGEPDAVTLQPLRDLAADPPATATAAACGYAGKVLVARFDDMSTPFSVLTWDRLLPLSEWDASAARSFAERSIDATAPEPRAC